MTGHKGFRRNNRITTFAGIEQANVGTVAGLTPDTEQNWELAGKMPRRGSECQTVSAVEGVNLALTHELASRGWDFVDSDLVIGRSVANVFFFALLAANGACEVTGLPNLVDRFRADFTKDAELAASLTCEEDRHRYLYRYGHEGAFQQGQNLQWIIDQSDNAPICLIDLQGVATRLCSRMGRPLLNIELVDHEPGCAERVTWKSQSRV